MMVPGQYQIQICHCQHKELKRERETRNKAGEVRVHMSR